MIARTTSDPVAFRQLVFPFLQGDLAEASPRSIGVVEPVFGAARIGPVYTPPEYRGRGYASALTATVAHHLSKAGDHVCLFTDLANPTSNRIYAAIGFRPVRDLVGYAFS